MIAYSWDDKYLTGHAEIDIQHRELFAILNQLYTALKEHQGEEAIGTTLDELTRYAQYHFDTEERVMRECAFPAFDTHCSAHQQFTRQILAMRNRSTAPHAFELLNFIGGWIVEHVGHSDVQIGRHLAMVKNLEVPGD